MTSRELGSSFRTGRPRIVTRGTDLQPRLKALESAVAAGRGRLDDDLLDTVEASVARSAVRLRMSAAHTIVAIAGATGSGKSATFNAVAGVELSRSGAQRPTTSTARALVWSDEDIEEMLEWLGVPAANQHRRASLTVRLPRTRLPEGLVLLDLPDHDSVEVAHHLEAERIVELADMLIWVVDPQKYADAAIHRRFLRPLASHRDVTMVVLNHIDTVPEERRQAMLRDLRKVLAADGIRDARVLATSARHGIGMDDLRTAIRRRVEEKHNSTLRVTADIRAAASRLHEASGDAPLSVPDVWIADLERRVADAAGVPALVARSARATRDEVRRGLAWSMRGDGDGARGPNVRAGRRQLGPVDRRSVDTAVRSFADSVCRDLGHAWADPIRAAATDRLSETDDRLDAELAALRFPEELPGWLGMVRLGRGLAASCLVGGTGLIGADQVLGGSSATLLTVGAVLLALGVVLGVGASLVSMTAGARAADQQARAIEDACRRTIARVMRGQVVDPVRSELAPYARFRRGVDAART